MSSSNGRPKARPTQPPVHIYINTKQRNTKHKNTNTSQSQTDLLDLLPELVRVLHHGPEVVVQEGRHLRRHLGVLFRWGLGILIQGVI